jgi:hypothetical protein
MRPALTFGAAQAVQDRANERGWSYSIADSLRESLTRGVTLSVQSDQDGPATAALDMFSRSYEAATRQESGPFPGCESCPSPCFFRFDVQRLITPALRTGMTRGLTDGTVKSALTRYKSAATLVLEAAVRWLSKEVRRPHGIAYCAALTTAASAGLDEYQQLEFGKQVAPHLL